MAAPLSSIIDTIISRSKRIEICDTLQESMIATTQTELISSGLPLAVYAYESGIVDDALLGDLSEATLNSFGVYTVGTYTLTNPPEEIFILKTANVTVNITLQNKCKINILGTGILTLIAGDQSYTTVKGYGNTTLTITINDDALVHADTKGSVNAIITANNNAILHCNQREDSNVALIANNNSFCKFQLWANAALDYTSNHTATVDAVGYQSATIIGIGT